MIEDFLTKAIGHCWVGVEAKEGMILWSSPDAEVVKELEWESFETNWDRLFLLTWQSTNFRAVKDTGSMLIVCSST